MLDETRMLDESSRTVTIVVADGYRESKWELAKAWQALLSGLGQKPQILEANNLRALLKMALHDGIGGSQADLVSLGGGFSNGDNPRDWLLPRNGGCASASSIYDVLQVGGFKGYIVAIAYDVALLSPANFHGIWPRDLFCGSPQKFRPLARKLFGLK